MEINHTPSFATDTPLDDLIKKNVIFDAINLLNVNYGNITKIKANLKSQIQKRVLTGKKIKITPEEKEKLIKSSIKERDNYENENLGNYIKIFPFDV